MKGITVTSFEKDPRSFVTYLGKARAKEIVFQGTESNLCLLDLVFEASLEDGHQAEFLIRLETPLDQGKSWRLKEAAARVVSRTAQG